MKKNQAKNKQQPKTKIQLKIKSKNVTNNFILTPRTASVLDAKDHFLKNEKFTEEIKSERQRKEESTTQKNNKESKKPEYRMLFTDHPKTTIKKKYEEDETGTHTPLLKRVSFNSQIGNKKKSTHSLMNVERSKQKKKTNSKLSNSTSGEINKTTLQRLIGVIIKDYREGKLKERQLQQTLMELYDQKEKKKSLGKNKKRKDNSGLNTFSNEFIKSSHQIRSEALVRRRKKSDEIQESILQRKGFVNKIIIKGITTSLFLKEDAQLPNMKQHETKSKIQQPSYQIHTSNSIKQICDDMIMVQERVTSDKKNVKMSLQERMAIKIQRAWRRYKTRKLLKDISSNKKNERNQQPFHILDQFTDEDNDEPYYQSRFTRNIVPPNEYDTQSKPYSELVNLISDSLQEKKLSKEECLKKILRFLKYPEELLSVAEKVNNQAQDDQFSSNQKSSFVILACPLVSQQQQTGKQSRVIIFNCPQQANSEQKQQSSEQLSNELNSFTNKYSSKEVNNEHREFFMPQNENTSQLDESLTFAHSQTASHESFKMINIQNIEEGLKGREESLQMKKEKQLEELTEKLFADKLTKEEYLKQKEKIEKWFKNKQRELKKIKNSLMKSCMEAKSILENDTTLLKTEKSKKMLKCLSDKYIKKQNWAIKQQQSMEKPISKATQHLQCQQNEFDHIKAVNKHEKQEKEQKLIQNDVDDAKAQLIFNKRDAFQVQWEQSKAFQISPKLNRHTSLDENEYKYQQIERVIEEDDDNIEEGLGKIENRQLESDKLINLAQNEIGQISAQQISLINNYVNQTTRRFKYLCTEDKQDIFQFLFLDLVLEMFTELYPGQSKILKAAEVYINRAKRLRKIPKGIKTSLSSCKDYLRLLHGFVSKTENSLKGLSIPMGPSASQMLRYMRDEIVEAEDEDNMGSTLVLPVQIFERLGKTKELELKLERYYQDDEKQTARISFLKTALHINNKALFDSLNEMLDHQRPYGVWGKPFPWKKALCLNKKWSKKQEEMKLKLSIDKTVQCCSYLCGILVDKEDSLFGTHRVSQQYIMQIRQDRLSKMLANDLIENEERWIFYDDEETEILMQISAYVTKKLIKELVLELVTIRMRI